MIPANQGNAQRGVQVFNESAWPVAARVKLCWRDYGCRKYVDTLTKYWIQQAVESLGGQGCRPVPSQQSMILLDQKVLFGIIPEQAFQPPMGDVQAVSPVSSQKFHVHRLNTLLKVIGLKIVHDRPPPRDRHH